MKRSVIPNFSERIAVLKNNTLMRAGFWLTLANLITGVLGYVYQVLMGRMLSPGEFALFSAVMALFMFFASPFGAMYMLVSRQVSNLRGEGLHSNLHHFYYFILGRLGFLVITLLVLLVIFQRQLQNWLNTDLVFPVWFFFLIMVFNAYFLVNNAFFQGMQRFDVLGGMTLASVILKIIASVLFIYWGLSVLGALMGVTFSLLITWSVGFFLLTLFLPKTKDKTNYSQNAFPLRSVLPVLIANIAFAAMTQLDMVLVNKLFTSSDAGAYAAASVLGKAVLYIPGGLVMALFPLVAESHAQNEESYPVLIQALLVTMLLCTFVALIYWLFSDFIIMSLYGSAYSGASDLLKWYGFAILPMALVLVAEYFLIAKGEVLFTWLFLAMSPFQIGLIFLWNDQLWQIVAIMGGCGFALLTIGLIFLLKRYLIYKQAPS